MTFFAFPPEIVVALITSLYSSSSTKTGSGASSFNFSRTGIDLYIALSPNHGLAECASSPIILNAALTTP